MKKIINFIILLAVIGVGLGATYFMGFLDVSVLCVDDQISETVRVKPFTDFSLPVKQREKQEFLGWYTSETGGQALTDSEGKGNKKLSVFQDVTAYARYTERVDFTVELVYFGGTSDASVNEIEVKLNKEINVSLPTPTKADHIFEGWYTATADSGIMIADDMGEMTDEGRVFKKNVYKIEKDYKCSIYARWAEFRDKKTYLVEDLAATWTSGDVMFKNALQITLDLSSAGTQLIDRNIKVSRHVERLILVGGNTAGSSHIFENLTIMLMAREKAMHLELNNFSYRANKDSIALTAQSDVVITLVGNNEIYGFDGDNSISLNGGMAVSASGDINVNGVGSLMLHGGKGGSGSIGASGKDGSSFNYQVLQGNKKIDGGNGGNGGDGGNGGNAGSGGDGIDGTAGTAGFVNKWFVVETPHVSNGGNGGSGGNGGKSGTIGIGRINGSAASNGRIGKGAVGGARGIVTASISGVPYYGLNETSGVDGQLNA